MKQGRLAYPVLSVQTLLLRHLHTEDRGKERLFETLH